MTMPIPVLTAMLAASSSSSGKPTASSSLGLFLPLLIFGLLAWVLFLRPRSQQAKRQREELMAIEIGDEVLTGAGIFGTVIDVEGDRVVLETAPGSQVTILRSTIARRLTEPEPVEDDHDDWDDEEHGAAIAEADDAPDDHAAGPGNNGRGDPGLGDNGRGEGSARTGEGG